MKFQTRYNRINDCGLTFEAASLVQPQYKDSSDINIMLRRALGGDMSVFVGPGKFIDASDSPDSFHDALNICARAETAWANMPDSLKRTFGNASAFLAWLESRSLKDSVSTESSSEPIKDSVTPPGAEVSEPKSASNT